MERDCESELSKLNIEQNACIYHFGASVIHGQRSNILRLQFNNSIPKWTSTNTKSKKWGADGATASISATVTVAEDGGTSVKYFTGDKYAENNKFEKYMLNGSEE